MYEGRITFPTEIVYLNYIRRLHYEIPGADETLRSFESRDRFRQLKSVGIVGFFFFLKKTPTNQNVCYQAYRISPGIQPKINYCGSSAPM